MNTIIIKDILEILIINCITKYKSTYNPIYLHRIYELTFSLVYDLIYDYTQDIHQSNYYSQKIYQNMPYEMKIYDGSIDLSDWLKTQINNQLLTINVKHPAFSNLKKDAV